MFVEKKKKRKKKKQVILMIEICYAQLAGIQAKEMALRRQNAGFYAEPHNAWVITKKGWK